MTDRIIACPDPNMSVLVANRGEIARRIIRSTDDWGVRSVAVFADPDESSPHVAEATDAVRIGPAALNESYLSIPAIIEAAVASGATHVHPGYGFLAERAEFATAVEAAGLTWVGPGPNAIARMGSKIEARGIAVEAGVPVIPGFNDSQDDGDLAAAAGSIGYPVLIKASAGGGGKGIRIAHEPERFHAALTEARTEAERAFGDGAVIVERYITRPRHIEVQVAGDRRGTVVDLGTRECSVQRRYQKVLEEAPAPNLDSRIEAGLTSATVGLAEAMEYDSLGTVEFIVDAGTGDWFFLEMNTRIQVEHTVTEEIFGVDLVQLQLAISSGAELSDIASGLEPAGHAFEVRINAEDPWKGFVPDTGQIIRLEIPDGDGIRWDGAVELGSVVSPHYDSMIGKLIVRGNDRLDALSRLEAALAATRIEGVATTVDFHRWLIRRPAVRAATVTTRFLDETPLPRARPLGPADVTSPWSRSDAHRLTPHRSAGAFDSPARDGRWSSSDQVGGTAGGSVRSPFPGLVTEVLVAPGEAVEHGHVLVTIEAMKMLHPVPSAGHGVIEAVHVEPGQQVAAGDPLVTFANPKDTP